MAPSAPPRASDAGIAHEHRGRRGVVPQEAEAAAEQRGGEDQELAGAGDEMDAEVFGEVDVADDIGDHAQRAAGDHHRHDGKAVQPVGQVHRIGGADDHDHAEGHEEQAEVQQRVLEERQGQLVGQRLAGGSAAAA